MTDNVSDIAFSAAVKAIQERKGSRRGYARMEEKGGWKDTISDELAAFIGERDFFYLGTASADGQPYIQHRGGRPGFLKVIDEKTLAFADFTGNRQYITAGNLSENDQAFIFLMDYANKRRIKIWGQAKVIEDDAALLERLSDVSEDGMPSGTPEQAIVFEVAAWDVNCPQHITPRFTEAQVAAVLDPMNKRVRDLEAEVAALKAQLV